ncbi:MAG TPA: prolyl oligopeptidase family serine peptidase, partial [Acidobacteriota bacterium]|nr:prolyl oligopeptidase family serine peptidase [Acidobacteriota bacterium]
SLGGAVLLESLKGETRFAGVIAECPFASFREVAYDRVPYPIGLGPWPGKTVFWPTVETGILWAKLYHHVDLDQASPADAVENTRTPILLIHGASDYQTPTYNSRLIQQNNPAMIQLWEVPGATHIRALFTQPAEFERRVFDWIDHQSGQS